MTVEPTSSVITAIDKPMYILSIEAKDLYAASQLVKDDQSDVGYSIRDSAGEIRLNKFVNTYDWSLDSIKLQEVYEKVTRRKDFCFRCGKHLYTQVVINVKFSYSYKQFNKAGKNTFIKAGYSFKDCNIVDGAYLKNGELIAIQTNVEVQAPLGEEVLGRYFKYINGHYEQVGTIPTLMSKSKLREHLYNNGFVCDGIPYSVYKRSSGSSRVGKCLFVNSTVSERMHKWDKCGLTLEHGSQIDLAAWEAYIALPLSSIIELVEINPEEILVIDDFESRFKENVIACYEQDGRLVSQQEDIEISNSIWDGQSLLDVSMFDKHPDKGMLVLRNRFFKTCAFNTNIQKWFEDNDVTCVEQLSGFTLATDIKQIKLITTPNSIKYMKFGKLEQWLANIDSTFGVVKHEKETHFFNGRMVQTHYQLINTLQLNKKQVAEFLKPTLDYLNALRSDISVFRHHIKYTFPSIDNVTRSGFKTKNDIVFKLLGLNDKFAQTKIFKEFRNKLVRGFVKNLLRGHVLVSGNYATLFGNPMEMLKSVIGIFKGDSEFEAETIHCKKFEDGKTILASRSPHITMGNVLLAKNVYYSGIEDYFNLSNEIVCVNSIDENTSQRLNGSDFDSDAMLLTDNEILINAAERNYSKFLVPVNLVQAKKISRVYTPSERADLDIKTSVNKIGEIVNLSQQLNSLFWDRAARGESIEDSYDLYEDICKLAVLSGVEIDRAKKEVNINSQREIDALAKKHRVTQDGKTVKPEFFKTITTENGFALSDNVEYRKFETPMDYLQGIVSETNAKQSRAYARRSLPLSDILCKLDCSSRYGYSVIQREKIIKIIQCAAEEIRALRSDYHTLEREEKKYVERGVQQTIQDSIQEIEKFHINEYTAGILLREIERKENKAVARLMFTILFNLSHETFYGLVDSSVEEISRLVETEQNDAEIDTKIFDFVFKKEVFCAKIA